MKSLYYPIAIILFLFVVVAPVHAEQLTLIDGQNRYDLSMESVRELADVEFTLFAPFRGREIKFKGLYLETLLRKHLLRVPKKIELVAYDGYRLAFEKWRSEHWVIVTHEDDTPLSLRNQGPVRLVERNYDGKNPKNLRNFNDWIWMIRSIETQP